jgi:hypothetical protein
LNKEGEKECIVVVVSTKLFVRTCTLLASLQSVLEVRRGHAAAELGLLDDCFQTGYVAPIPPTTNRGPKEDILPRAIVE